MSVSRDRMADMPRNPYTVPCAACGLPVYEGDAMPGVMPVQHLDCEQPAQGPPVQRKRRPPRDRCRKENKR